MAKYLGFPSPANNKTARVVAGGVVLLSILGLVTGWNWLLVVISAGCWLRVLAGPSLSPLAIFANKVVAPRLGKPDPTPGPPKRFAQAVGGATTLVGAILAFGFGVEAAATVTFAIMCTFATLESIFGICVGCKMFSGLMRLGVIPKGVCEECANVNLRRA